MLKTMDIMKEENLAIAGREGIQGTLNGYTVNNANLRKVASSKTSPIFYLRDALYHLIERHDRQHTPAQAHQHDIEGHPVQPGGEKRFTAKRIELAMQLKKCFLRQVFCK